MPSNTTEWNGHCCLFPTALPEFPTNYSISYGRLICNYPGKAEIAYRLQGFLLLNYDCGVGQPCLFEKGNVEHACVYE